jgi:nucleoside 2-deoxyribosyltransferase
MSNIANNLPAQSKKVYTIYGAGKLFSQHEITTNVFLKEAVWRLSDGKFQIYLPQSKESQELNRSAMEAYIRNMDLLGVLRTDITIAQFDGLELDSGTVVEFTFAKSLGKPTVTLRTDFRGLTSDGLDGPYNLMAKNWPRNVDLHINSMMDYGRFLASDHYAIDGDKSAEALLKAEGMAAKKAIDETALKLIGALEAVLKMESPYPVEYREMLYKALRHSPAAGFDELLSEADLDALIEGFKNNGTL